MVSFRRHCSGSESRSQRLLSCARSFLRVGALALAIATAATSPLADSPGTLSGGTGQFVELRPSRPSPDITFSDESGGLRRLSEFRGRTVLLNIWGTWCAPCIKEMPALARLSAALGAERFAVIAIAIDRGGLAVVKPFFTRHGLGALPIYVDPEQRSVFAMAGERRGDALGPFAVPIAYVIDRQGMLIGYLGGAFDWDSVDAHRFIAHLDGMTELPSPTR